MYRFYNTSTNNIQEDFDNLEAAITGHDYPIVLGLLRDNKDLLNQKTNDGKTVPMLVAKAGCTPEAFQIILELSSNILHEETSAGESVQSILIKNRRVELLKIFKSFVETDNQPEHATASATC